MTVLQRCRSCRSLLGPWEQYYGGCACRGPASETHRDTLYAVACAAKQPLPVHDLVRLAQQDYGDVMNQSTGFAVLAPDPRFCWAGPGAYGLYRHGVIPGPRNLEQTARLVLAAAGNLHMDAVDFILKQLGYRYSFGSLRNAVGRSDSILWDGHWWSHPTGEGAMRLLQRDIPVVPPFQDSEFNEIIRQLERQARKHLATRESRLSSISTAAAAILSIDWGDG